MNNTRAISCYINGYSRNQETVRPEIKKLTKQTNHMIPAWIKKPQEGKMSNHFILKAY